MAHSLYIRLQNFIVAYQLYAHVQKTALVVSRNSRTRRNEFFEIFKNVQGILITFTIYSETCMHDIVNNNQNSQ